MTNNNFKWLANDIDSTLVLKVISNESNSDVDYGTYCVQDVLESDWDKIDIKTANIDDLTNLLTLGIVRFVNMIDSTDILDIPFRNLYKLYKNANVLGGEQQGRMVSFKELETFSVIDDEVRNDLLIYAAVVTDVSDDLDKVMKIAYEFGNYRMQEKFDALSDVNIINHRRLIEDEKNRTSR